MNETTIKYGNSTLELTKSSNLVAVKPTRGRTPELEKTVSHLGAEPTKQVLSGFQLVNVYKASQSMEDTLNTLRNDEAVSVGTHVYHTSADGVPFIPTGQMYLVFTDNAPLEECQKLIERYHLQVLEIRGERELLVQVTPNSSNPIKVATSLQSSPLVSVVEPDLATPGKVYSFVLPADNLLSRQWHLRNTGTLNGSTFGLKAGADAGVVAAWEHVGALGSRDVIVAVIDDGFDLSHPDLSGIGKVIAPWDFTRNNSDPRPEFSQDYPYYDPSTGQVIGDWHGTACAGVAIGNANGIGILGAAPGCRFMPVRWGPNLTDAQVEAWFKHVQEQGAWVVSCSWSASAQNFPLSIRKQQAIARCAHDGRNNLGCVICFAAGNESRNINDITNSSVNGFAIHPDVIAVAASNSMDQQSNYSNYGDAISICAPSNGAGGHGILTSDVIGTFLRDGQQIESGYSPGAYTSTFGGTSSATPLVAGICALLLSIKPDLTAKQVKELIQGTARKIGSPGSYDTDGHSQQFGYGCIDAAKAVKSLLDVTPMEFMNQPLVESLLQVIQALSPQERNFLTTKLVAEEVSPSTETVRTDYSRSR